MRNRDLDATWAYHNGTKHTYQSIRTNPHYLDWENQPIPFKIYSGLEPIPLRRQLSSSGMPALAAIAAITAPGEESVRPTSQTLAEILDLAPFCREPTCFRNAHKSGNGIKQVRKGNR